MDRRLAALGAQLGEIVDPNGHVAVVVAARRVVDTETPVEIDLHLRGTLRRVFADPGMVHQLGPRRFAVLARRHPGLALTVTTLAQQLASDPVTVGADVRISCEPLPERAGEIVAFVERLAVEPMTTPPGRAGLDTRTLGGPAAADTADGEPGRRTMTGPVLSLATAACFAVAVLVGGAGLAGVRGHYAPTPTNLASTVPARPGLPAGGGPVVDDGRDGHAATSGPAGSSHDEAAAGGDTSHRSGGDGETAAPVDGPVNSDGDEPAATTTVPGDPEQATGAALVVVGMELAGALELVPEGMAVTSVFVGVPEAHEVPPESVVVVALQGPTPADLCGFVAQGGDVVMVADEPVCDDPEPVELPAA